MVIFPLLIVAYNKIRQEKHDALQESVKASVTKGLEVADTEIIIIDRNESIIWITQELKEIVSGGKVPERAVNINNTFKRAYENPSRSFLYIKEGIAYKVTFDAKTRSFFHQNVTEKLKLEERLHNKKEVVGIICINFFNKEEQWHDKHKPMKVEFERIVIEWARRNNILASEIGEFSFILQMKNKDYSKVKNENFSILNDVEYLVNQKDVNAVALLSLAIDMETSFIAGEKVREGIVDLARGNVSAVSIKTEDSSDIVYLNEYKNEDKSMGVYPEGFVDEKSLIEDNNVEININAIEEEHDRQLDTMLEFENNMEQARRNERRAPEVKPFEEPFIKSTKHPKQPSNKPTKTPDWLKDMISKHVNDSPMNSSSSSQEASGRYTGTLLEEMEASSKILCYFSNLSNKSQLLLALLVGVFANQFGKECFHYSEKPFSPHYTFKNNLDEANLGVIHKSIVDAFTFKRLEKKDVLYLVVNSDDMNTDLIDTTIPHKIVYMNRGEKELIRVFLDSLKSVASNVSITLKEKKLIQQVAKRARDNGGNKVLSFIQGIKVSDIHEPPKNEVTPTPPPKKNIVKPKIKEEIIAEESKKEPEVEVAPIQKKEATKESKEVTLERFSTNDVDMGMTLEFTFSDVKRSFYEHVKQVKGLKVKGKVLASGVDKEINATPIEIDEVAQEFSSLEGVSLLIVFAKLFNDKQVGIIYSNSESINAMNIAKGFKNASGNKRRATFENEETSLVVPKKELTEILKKL